MEQVEVPNIIDHNNNVTKEEAMGNDCHDSNIDIPRDELPSRTQEPTMRNYRNKSERSIRRYNNKTINGNDIQLNQKQKKTVKFILNPFFYITKK